MTKVTMLDPVAWIRRHPDGALSAEFLEDASIDLVRKESGAWLPLITTTQAEAYANARVKQALEKAAKVPRDYAEEIDNGLFGKRYPEQAAAIFNASENMADRIRALIPEAEE